MTMGGRVKRHVKMVDKVHRDLMDRKHRGREMMVVDEMGTRASASQPAASKPKRRRKRNQGSR